jgi:hypothetical protein
MRAVKELEIFLSMDWKTIVILAVLCMMASYFIKEYLALPPMIIFVYPVLLFLSIATQRIFIAFEAYPPKKLDAWLMWTILAAIVGNIIGTCLVACLGRLRERLDRAPKPPSPARHGQHA